MLYKFIVEIHRQDKDDKQKEVADEIKGALLDTAQDFDIDATVRDFTSGK